MSDARFTVDFVVNDAQAQAVLGKLRQDIPGTFRVVPQEITDWQKGLKRFGDQLYGLTLSGGAMYAVWKMAMGIKEAFESAGNKLAGNWEHAKQYSYARELAMQSMLPGMTPAALDAMVSRIGASTGGTATGIVQTLGAIMGSMRYITPEQLEGVGQQIHQRVIRTGRGEDLAVPMGQAFSAISNQFKLSPEKAMMVFDLWRKEWFGDDPAEFAHNVAPMASRLAPFVGGSEQDRLAQIMAITNLFSSQMADPTGATTATASFLGLMGMWGKTLTGEKLPEELNVEQRIMRWGDSVAAYEKAHGRAKTMEAIRSRFEGRAVSEGATSALLHSVSTEQGRENIHEAFVRAAATASLTDEEVAAKLFRDQADRVGGPGGSIAKTLDIEQRLAWEADVAKRGTAGTQAAGMYTNMLRQFIAADPAMAGGAAKFAETAMGLAMGPLAESGVPPEEASRQAYYNVMTGLSDYMAGRPINTNIPGAGAVDKLVMDVMGGGAGAKSRLTEADRLFFSQRAAASALAAAGTPEEAQYAAGLGAAAQAGIEGLTPEAVTARRESRVAKVEALAGGVNAAFGTNPAGLFSADSPVVGILRAIQRAVERNINHSPSLRGAFDPLSDLTEPDL